MTPTILAQVEDEIQKLLDAVNVPKPQKFEQNSYDAGMRNGLQMALAKVRGLRRAEGTQATAGTKG